VTFPGTGGVSQHQERGVQIGENVGQVDITVT
jgi:hypothetical protein